MNVYLVRIGDHDCCHHLGIFSTLEKAEAFVRELAKIDASTPPEIDTISVDSVRAPVRAEFDVEITRDGAIQEVRRGWYRCYHKKLCKLGESTCIYHYQYDCAKVSVYALSATHAIELAQEQLALSHKLGCWKRGGDWEITNGVLRTRAVEEGQ